MNQAETNPEILIAEDIASFYADPEGFVLYAFPWGEPGPLENAYPDEWQLEQLRRIGEAIRANPDCSIQEAISSGHGIGKSAETAWIVLWAMSTRPHLSGVVTANTQTQLKTKTWRELAVWHKRCINEHWFKWTATSFSHVDHPETWCVNAIPNTEQNSEAFAGLHAEHVLVIYDEASAIPDSIWEVTEGAMTTPRAMWFTFGNPTKNTGRFRQCWTKFKQRWVTRQIDSRSCRMTDKSKLSEWEQDYGEDSDFFRVRVRGLFPRAASGQFISNEPVMIGRDLMYEEDLAQPLILGADVARFGDDQSAITLRRGRKVLEQTPFPGLSTTQCARKIKEYIDKYSPDAVFIDGGGVGGGVIDSLKDWNYQVIEVQFGGAPTTAKHAKRFKNRRAEMWGLMRDALEAGLDIPDDQELEDDLVGPEYKINEKQQIVLESKQSMKDRGLASPDLADSLALTFADRVMKKRKPVKVNMQPSVNPW